MRAYLLLPLLVGSLVAGTAMGSHAAQDPIGFLGVGALLAVVGSLTELIAGHLAVSPRDGAPPPVRTDELFGLSVGLSALVVALAAGAAAPHLSLGPQAEAAVAGLAPATVGLLMALWLAPGTIRLVRGLLGFEEAAPGAS